MVQIYFKYISVIFFCIFREKKTIISDILFATNNHCGPKDIIVTDVLNPGTFLLKLFTNLLSLNKGNNDDDII